MVEMADCVASVYLDTGGDLEPDFLGVSRIPKLENLGVRQKSGSPLYSLTII